MTPKSYLRKLEARNYSSFKTYGRAVGLLFTSDHQYRLRIITSQRTECTELVADSFDAFERRLAWVVQAAKKQSAPSFRVMLIAERHFGRMRSESRYQVYETIRSGRASWAADFPRHDGRGDVEQLHPDVVPEKVKVRQLRVALPTHAVHVVFAAEPHKLNELGAVPPDGPHALGLQVHKALQFLELVRCVGIPPAQEVQIRDPDRALALQPVHHPLKVALRGAVLEARNEMHRLNGVHGVDGRARLELVLVGDCLLANGTEAPGSACIRPPCHVAKDNLRWGLPRQQVQVLSCCLFQSTSKYIIFFKLIF